MSGFGRHTSKVIAYLRDQVGPPRRSLNSSLPYRCILVVSEELNSKISNVRFRFTNNTVFNRRGAYYFVRARSAKYTKPSLTLYLNASAVRPERRSVKKARTSGSLVKARPPGRLIASTAAFRFARETPNGYSALKSRSQRDTLIECRTETERPKLIGPKISIDRTILMPTYQFALRTLFAARRTLSTGNTIEGGLMEIKTPYRIPYVSQMAALDGVSYKHQPSLELFTCFLSDGPLQPIEKHCFFARWDCERRGRYRGECTGAGLRARARLISQSEPKNSGAIKWAAACMHAVLPVFRRKSRIAKCNPGVEREREREVRAGERREESPTVRYWRMISCLHSSDPVSSEGEMRAGPIWNNRIPFAIVFLSVSLFLCPTMGTNAYRLPACVCVRGYKRACSQYALTGKERYGDKRAHTFVLVMRYAASKSCERDSEVHRHERIVRRHCYHGFHVLRDPGVPRVPANGTTVDCEQLRQDDQHVLEHHQFHVSARVYDSSFSSRSHDGDPRIDHVMSECGLFMERTSLLKYVSITGRTVLLKYLKVYTDL
ncbi:hypothetical protein ALC60_10112 [Trachymyrmex zeteki]|uniref:Uncharacterized protein n=1 Tax=Mycetomoellerius zeteki TaxID=64791 RepID=A0A151WSI3_9HYME|nr:hypothetical protein ALC60_10112 [Trachymyrmex zeteki]